MPKAIVIHEFGKSDVMALEDIELAEPKAGEIRIRQTAIGVNFHDIYVRSGLYHTLVPPGILGCEAVGIIEGIGDGVQGVETGERVAYVTGPPYGAYASHRNLRALAAVTVPNNLNDKTVAANLLRSLTVDMLTKRVTRLEPGMTILVHAAAGGVGRLLCQMASHMGATVIGTVGSSEKSEIATSCGCKHPILYRQTDFAAAVSEITDGKGVDVVYDSIGADTFEGSFAAASKCGHLVNFGQSSGPVASITMSKLAEKSLTVSRPILFHYLEDSDTYHDMTSSVFEAVAKKVLQFDSPQIFTLADAGEAHDLLASGAAVKSLVLTT